MEQKLQREIIKWLKAGGAYVIKTRPGGGTPYGCPDIVAFFQDRWAVVEVKASATASFRPGQWETLQKLGEGNRHVHVTYPEIWEKTKADLMDNFFQSAYGQ